MLKYQGWLGEEGLGGGRGLRVLALPRAILVPLENAGGAALRKVARAGAVPSTTVDGSLFTRPAGTLRVLTRRTRRGRTFRVVLVFGLVAVC